MLGIKLPFHHKRKARHLESREAVWSLLLDNKLEIQFQPKIAIQTQDCVGFEALLRPTSMFPERMTPKKIVELISAAGGDELLLDRTFKDAGCVLREEFGSNSEIKLAINVTELELSDPEFAKRCAYFAEKAVIDCNRFIFEVPSGCLAKKNNAIITQLLCAVEEGFNISIDGCSAASSLNKIRDHVPIYEFKLGRALLARAMHNQAAKEEIAFLVSIADHHNAIITAVGVESVNELQVMKALGVTCIQGHFIEKAIPAGSLSAWYKNWQAKKFSALIEKTTSTSCDLPSGGTAQLDSTQNGVLIEQEQKKCQ